jgi:hypothetical protein
MKLKSLLQKEILNNEQQLREKKEVIGNSPAINLTFHLDHKFSNVGENGKPELSFTISVSSTGGKEYYKNVSDQQEKEKFELAVRKEINRAAKRLNKNIEYIINKYKLQPRVEEE